jgi:hypothetical protein
MAKHSSQILELARKGAEHRLRELTEEMAALKEVFRHLRFGAAISPAMPDAVEEGRVRRRRRKRSKMSAAARKAVSVRMKKYWAAKRKSARG